MYIITGNIIIGNIINGNIITGNIIAGYIITGMTFYKTNKILTLTNINTASRSITTGFNRHLQQDAGRVSIAHFDCNICDLRLKRSCK